MQLNFKRSPIRNLFSSRPFDDEELTPLSPELILNLSSSSLCGSPKYSSRDEFFDSSPRIDNRAPDWSKFTFLNDNACASNL